MAEQFYHFLLLFEFFYQHFFYHDLIQMIQSVLKYNLIISIRMVDFWNFIFFKPILFKVIFVPKIRSLTKKGYSMILRLQMIILVVTCRRRNILCKKLKTHEK